MTDAPALRLWPDPTFEHRCPRCEVALEAKGVWIPGMRTLADLQCPKCGMEYYGDLPTGHGLAYPALLDKETGEVFHRGTMVVFADYLGRSYRERQETAPELTIETFRTPEKPVLLNCLDWLYGHSLLKLLNAQYHLDHHQDWDLVVLVPKYLRWLVPEGAAEIWTVDLPLSRGWEWNDGLAANIAERLEGAEWRLSPAFPHPRREDFELERFTGVTPFPLDEWIDRSNQPKVTYVWRGDRDWGAMGSSPRPPSLRDRLNRKLGRELGLRIDRIAEFADELRQSLPALDFAVIGLDAEGDFPDWIKDLRDPRPSPEREVEWCRRLAASHLAIGVHGSNMLIPSGLAGGIIEWIPNAPWDSRWGNVIQDLLVRGEDPRDILYRYRFLPMEVEVREAASIAASIVHGRPSSWSLLDPEWNDHHTVATTWRDLPEKLKQAEPPPSQPIS